MVHDSKHIVMYGVHLASMRQKYHSGNIHIYGIPYIQYNTYRIFIAKYWRKKLNFTKLKYDHENESGNVY